MKLFRGSAGRPESTLNLEAYARLNEMLRQERERVAALTEVERAREEAERERDTRDLAAELWRSSTGFMQVLMAAQETAKKASQRAVIEGAAAMLGATVESIEEVGHE